MAKVRTNVRFTVIFLDGKRLSRIVRTPPGKALLPAGVDKLLEQEAERLERFCPGREFRLVPLANGTFNFIEMSKEEAELRERRSELRDGCSQKAEAAAV